MMIRAERLKGGLLFGILAGLLMLTIVALALTKPTPANAAVTTTCNIALAIDRSASVGTALGDDNVTKLKDLIRGLFQPYPVPNGNGGVKEGNLLYSPADYIPKLGFWSFSSSRGGTQTGSNYDAPWSRVYVGTHGTTDSGYSTFNSNLTQIQALGGTSYEEGFGFKGYANFNNPPWQEQLPNTAEGIDRFIKQAQVIVFITDGVPATPGVGQDNQEAKDAGRRAVTTLLSDPKKIIMGALIQGQGGKLSSLNYVLNGNQSNGQPKTTDRFGNVNAVTINDYTPQEFTQKVAALADLGCSESGTQPQSNTYTSTPVTNANPRVASGDTTVTLHYGVTTRSDNGSASDPSDWTVYQMYVPPGVSANPLYFGGAPYKDNYSCQDEINSLNTNKAVSCVPIAQGNGRFPAQVNYSLDADADAWSMSHGGKRATQLMIDSSLPIGTKVCYILALSKPTDGFSPVNRFSQAACTAIGVSPTVSVVGGDLRVGGSFSGATGSTTEPAPATIQGASTAKKVDGKNMVFGSWVEYAAVAPGDISNFASSSGFKGGYDTSQQSVQYKLTFANTQGEYGKFVDKNSGMSTIPDYAKTIRESPSNKIVSPPSPLVIKNGGNTSGLYQYDSGDLTINTAPGGSLGKNESMVVYVPNGKVTIASDLRYYNGDDRTKGSYQSLDQVPQLIIIAKSIVINGNVTNVDAWLIADQTAASPSDITTGWVFTCDVLPPAKLSTSICNNQLTINGPVIAQHLSLRRTAGSGTGGSNPADPAEMINLPGTSYLWALSAGRNAVRAETTFTTELPPYF